MKKKILFNIAFILVTIFCVIFAYIFINFAVSDAQSITVFKKYEPQTDQTLSMIEKLRHSVFVYSLYATMSLLSVCFMVFMLVYINKNDIKELTVPVVQNVKESRQKKAEEKKQQQIQSLEEKLNQLKKDDK